MVPARRAGNCLHRLKPRKSSPPFPKKREVNEEFPFHYKRKRTTSCGCFKGTARWPGTLFYRRNKIKQLFPQFSKYFTIQYFLEPFASSTFSLAEKNLLNKDRYRNRIPGQSKKGGHGDPPLHAGIASKPGLLLALRASRNDRDGAFV